MKSSPSTLQLQQGRTGGALVAAVHQIHHRRGDSALH